MIPTDPVSVLLSILGLLGQYAAETARQKESERQTLQDWLGAHRHDELKELLATNHHLNAELHSLLRGNLSDLSASLAHIEGMVTQLLSRIPGFDRLAHAVHPDQILSEGSLRILQLWVDSGCSQLTTMPNPAGPHIMLSGCPNARQGQLYSVPDYRFLHDDLTGLVAAGLAREGMTANGEQVLHLARAGEAYIRRLSSHNKMHDQFSS